MRSLISFFIAALLLAGSIPALADEGGREMGGYRAALTLASGHAGGIGLMADTA